MKRLYLSLRRRWVSKWGAVQELYTRQRAFGRQTELLGADGKSLEGRGLFFVTGFDKSGTTWLMTMLNEHPQLCCRGAAQFFDYYQPGVHFLDSPGGYRRMVSSLLEQDWYRAKGQLWLSEQGVKQAVGELIVRSMLAFAQDPGVSLVGDKSTVQDCALIRSLLPAARIVAIVRDGRDVAVSFAYHFKRRGNPSKFTEEGRLAERHIIQSAHAWALYNGHLIGLRDGRDPLGLVVRYEDLLADTPAVLGGILEHLEVSPEEDLVERISARNRFEVLSGGRQAGEEDEGSFFRKGVAGDWLNHFGEEEAGLFREQAGSVLEAFGYHWPQPER